MKPIYIPDLLKLPQQTKTIEFEELIAGIECLTPTRGKIKIGHKGTYLEVKAVAETIVTLTCDRCLQNYNHRIHLDTSELIWLNRYDDKELSWRNEKELSTEDLNESIPSNGDFEPTTWLYEQLSLAMPVQQLCSEDCQPPQYQKTDQEIPIDSRWSSLVSLKNNWKQQ